MKKNNAELEVRIKSALEILTMMKNEIPKTVGEIKLNLIYEDICAAINKLKGMT